MIFKNYCIDEILPLLNSGIKLACFGSGKVFDRFCEEYKEYHIAEKIGFVIDNDSKKFGTFKFANGHRIPIYPVENAKKYAEDNQLIIIITVKKFESIWEQLHKISELDSSFVVVYSFMRDRGMFWHQENGDFEFEVKRDANYKIPKIIHYCWFGGKKMPDCNRRMIEGWKRLCPDFEIKEWNESNYDIRKNTYMREAYEAHKWGFVPDYARADIVYEHGGIYLDTDVELLKSLDDLLNQPAFCGFENMSHVNLGQGFGAIPKHPIIKAVRDFYEGKHFLWSDQSYNMIPSPTYTTEVLRQHGLKLNGKCQEIKDMNVYPRTAFCPKSYETGMMMKSDDTISIHHFDASWFDDDTMRAHERHMRLLQQCMENRPRLE